MKSMGIKKVVLLALVGFALVGCQKKDDKARVETRGNGARMGGAWAGGQQSGQLPGRVVVNPSYQDQFQEAVAMFLSPQMDTMYLGMVSSAGQYGTGVSFGGRVQLTSGSFRQAMMGGAYGNMQIAENSSIWVRVIDQYALQGGSLPLPDTNLARAQGYVSGNSVQVTFFDGFGQITLQGTFDQQRFQGEFLFRNNNDSSNWSLGGFEIPTCSFFNCN